MYSAVRFCARGAQNEPQEEDKVPQTMTYRAILFDLDDTLYDLRSYWRGRLHEAIDDVLARYPHFDRDALVYQAITEKVYIEKLPAFLRGQGVDDEPLIAAAQELFRRDWFGRLV